MSGTLNTLQGVLGSIRGNVAGMIDRIFPPEQREQALAKIKAFALANPKLAVS